MGDSTTEKVEGFFKTALVFGSGAAVAYFGMDRAIHWLPKFVHYGVASGVTMYAMAGEPNQPVGNSFIALAGSVMGIVGGEVVHFML